MAPSNLVDLLRAMVFFILRQLMVTMAGGHLHLRDSQALHLLSIALVLFFLRLFVRFCHSPGHSAVTCSSRFVQASNPALAVSTGESTSAVWFPDSGASAHMTPHEGHSHGEGSSSGFQ